MSNTWGERLRLTLFGESHGQAVGMVLDGLPVGMTVDMAAMEGELNRRAPGGEYASPRQERDEPHIISGLLEGKTTGAPLTLIFANEDAKSGDYQPGILRPGHSDWPAYVKYQGHNDHRGGGQFSGRLTAPLVAAGSIARQILAERDIVIGGHLQRLGGLEDESWMEQGGFPTATQLAALKERRLPFNLPGLQPLAEELLAQAAAEQNSVGAAVELAALGLPAGLGEPLFQGLESRIAGLMLAIPGVKGVEFGDGFAFAASRGDQVRDEYYLDKSGKPALCANHNGGALGGMSTGAPLIVGAAFKPTPSLAGTQRTVDISRNENIIIEPQGRHDPCIGLRGLVAAEAALALAIADMLLIAG